MLYCMSNESWSILYSKLIYEIGQDILDMPFLQKNLLIKVKAKVKSF